MELKDLKEGDKVVVYNRYGDSIKKVDRVTKTQIIVDGYKYRRETGCRIGGQSWYSSRIGICTEEEEKRINKEVSENRMKRYIKNFPFDELAYKDLEQVYNILKNSISNKQNN